MRFNIHGLVLLDNPDATALARTWPTVERWSIAAGATRNPWDAVGYSVEDWARAAGVLPDIAVTIAHQLVAGGLVQPDGSVHPHVAALLESKAELTRTRTIRATIRSQRAARRQQEAQEKEYEARKAKGRIEP